MKYMTRFVLFQFRVLYQGIDTDKMLGFSKLHSEKTKAVGRIDKVRALVGRGRESLKSMWKSIWEKGCQMKTFYYFFRVKIIVQLALQELNLSSRFNSNLALPDIIANKTSVESALPDKHCLQSYVSKPFARSQILYPNSSPTACVCVCFSFLLIIYFSSMSSHGTQFLH